MLRELANKVDLEGQYVTTADREIYTQYGNNKREIPPHTPFNSRLEHRDRAAQDTQALFARAEDLKATSPAPRGERTEARSRALKP